jgi:hypothetical protein
MTNIRESATPDEPRGDVSTAKLVQGCFSSILGGAARGGERYGTQVAQWRIELTTQDVVALSRGSEITVTAIDEEQELSAESIEVTISQLDL